MRGVLTGAGRALWATAIAVALVAVSAAPAAAQGYAPVDQPGPPLSVSDARLDASIRCSGPLAGPAEPVLLVPGTTVTPDKNFSWNWIPALNRRGRPWCTVQLPGSSMEDIQVAGEHVVHAIRTMSAEAGGRIDVLGHSQGGMVPRWALRFWPDTREMVDDLVGIAPSNHGTETAEPICALGGCAPAFWQQRSNSAFIVALNSHRETFAGVDYTVVYTITDVIVFPNLNDNGSSSLRSDDGAAVTNVAIQDVCPLDVSEHLAAGTISNTGYALARDALDNPGPAKPSRVPGRVCHSPLMPGVIPATVALDLVDAGAYLALTTVGYRRDPAEPPLACYVTATCTAPSAAGEPAPTVEPTATKRKRSKRR